MIDKNFMTVVNASPLYHGSQELMNFRPGLLTLLIILGLRIDLGWFCLQEESEFESNHSLLSILFTMPSTSKRQETDLEVCGRSG